MERPVFGRSGRSLDRPFLALYYVWRYKTPDTVTGPLRSLGRFADIAGLVLAALEDGPKHAFAMTRDIEARSGRRPGPAILYGAITRLVDREWIAPVATSDPRRPYRITSGGRTVLSEHLEATRAVPAFPAARPAQA